eukprot:CAMPEP_0175064008 /NCGR_PEP_ID=MMETSP0052_2-20121109/15081_1 /TAXON_ID=51329 ORGANISM="Polytomella parva, Strain SAG 63-3" /NCGR_SAMPLE_ID=MMETSP0052_2 /ASSEMBLY_ACC=CAM_ASM_000194 /LENGTH=155 /DNA_ID=CAMNT_0016330285 /DNA_START=97 /DNA_END=560 /DNA_ORIENTATION=-
MTIEKKKKDTKKTLHKARIQTQSPSHTSPSSTDLPQSSPEANAEAVLLPAVIYEAARLLMMKAAHIKAELSKSFALLPHDLPSSQLPLPPPLYTAPPLVAPASSLPQSDAMVGRGGAGISGSNPTVMSSHQTQTSSIQVVPSVQVATPKASTPRS